MKQILFSLLVITLFSCASKKNTEDKTQVMDSVTVVTDTMATAGRSVTTSTGKEIRIMEEHPIGMSLSDIRVVGAGMGDTVTFKDADPVADVLKGDLDKDGFDEVYIITSSAGSGSYGKVIGLASVRDSLLQVINIPAFADQAKSYDGYMGGDRFSIQGAELVRTFPLRKGEEAKATAAAADTSVRYGLVRKGSNYLLLEGKR